MKSNLIIVLVIMFSGVLHSQNPIWSLPNQTLINSAPPILSSLPAHPNGPSGYYGAPARFSHNAMIDAQGNLKFFVVDGVVHDVQSNESKELYAPAYSGGGSNNFPVLDTV